MSNGSYLGRGRLRRQPTRSTVSLDSLLSLSPGNEGAPDSRGATAAAGAGPATAYARCATRPLRPPRAFGPWPAAGRFATLATGTTLPRVPPCDTHPRSWERAVRFPVRRARAGPSRAHGRGRSARAKGAREQTRSPTAAHVQPDPPAVVRPAENATYDGQPQGRAGGRRERLLPVLLRTGHARRYGGLSVLHGTLAIAPNAHSP